MGRLIVVSALVLQLLAVLPFTRAGLDATGLQGKETEVGQGIDSVDFGTTENDAHEAVTVKCATALEQWDETCSNSLVPNRNYPSFLLPCTNECHVASLLVNVSCVPFTEPLPTELVEMFGAAMDVLDGTCSDRLSEQCQEAVKPLTTQCLLSEQACFDPCNVTFAAMSKVCNTSAAQLDKKTSPHKFFGMGLSFDSMLARFPEALEMDGVCRKEKPTVAPDDAYAIPTGNEKTSEEVGKGGKGDDTYDYKDVKEAEEENKEAKRQGKGKATTTTPPPTTAKSDQAALESAEARAAAKKGKGKLTQPQRAAALNTPKVNMTAEEMATAKELERLKEKTKELEAQNNQILGFSKSGFAGLIVMMLLVVVCVCCYFVRKKREAHDRADDLEFDGGMRTKIRHEFD